MRDKTKSIELLNRAVADELSAVHQYMYFHFHCDDMGYDVLSNLFKRTAIEEMMHVEVLAERILFLKGDVLMHVADPVVAITTPADMLKKAVAMESQSVEDYNLWANECSSNSDSMSKKVFEDLVASEELHLDQYEREMDNLLKFGDSYLALQSIERSKSVSGSPSGAAAQ